MNYANKAQITKLHVLLNQLGWIDEKKAIIQNITNGRTNSSRALYFSEATILIKGLAEYDPRERLKSLIFSLAYRSGIIYGATGEDKKMNAAKLNVFLQARGTVKKPLNDMSYPELIATHRQFEGIVKNVAQRSDNKAAQASVNHLLGELNINVLTR
jgi:hypothetical protein